MKSVRYSPADSCKILKQFCSIIHHCRSDYTWTEDDDASYQPGWTDPMSKENATDAYDQDVDQAS